MNIIGKTAEWLRRIKRCPHRERTGTFFENESRL